MQEVDTLRVTIQLVDGTPSPKSYTIDVEPTSIVFNVKRRLVKCIKIDKYTCGFKMNEDAQKWGLIVGDDTILVHSHLLSEYSDRIVASNFVIRAYKRKEVCDNCWRTGYKCLHAEGFYPDGLTTLYTRFHCNHCFGGNHPCTCPFACKKKSHYDECF